MPRDLHRDVQAVAQQQHRSFNAQIVDTLRKHTPVVRVEQEAQQ